MSKTGKWSFQESYSWNDNFKRCGAPGQSPINIDTELIKYCKSLCEFTTMYKPSKCFVTLSNNLLKIKYSSGSYLNFENVLYELTEITIHTPTLHSLDNTKYDMEICMIHKLSDDNTATTTSKTPNGVILSRLYEIGPHYGSSDSFINQIINDLPGEDIKYEKEIDVSGKWGASMLIPTIKSFYMYDGSLPFPPCDTNYKVIVYEDIGTIGRTNIERIKLNLGENIRNIQPINNRIVFYKIDYKNKKNKNTIVESKNKYLKCRQNQFIKNTPKETITTTAALEKEEEEDYGISKDTKNIIKQFGLTIVIVLILGTSVIFVKYLFYHKYAQKMLKVLIGPRSMVGWNEKWDDPNCVNLKTGDKPGEGSNTKVDKALNVAGVKK